MKNNVAINFSDEEARIRLLVLSFSLQVESLISRFLNFILNIKEPSLSLGNKSSSLSMNQKFNLMIDTKYFPVESKAQFITFMSIRNQFMHNTDATSFVDCIKNLDGIENYLVKHFPNSNSDKEEMLEQSWVDLTDKVMKTMGSALNKMAKIKRVRVSEHVTIHIDESEI